MPAPVVFDELVALLASHRVAGEASFRMAPEVRDALGAAGLFRAWVDHAYAGPGYELPGAVRLIEEVAYGDPSVAWAVVNSSGAASLVAQLPEAVAREAFMKADAFYGFGLPPTGRAVFG